MDPMTMTPAQQEAFAQKQGFQSYGQMTAYAAQRARLNGLNSINGLNGPVASQRPISAGPVQARPGWGPSAILGYVADRLRSVMP